MAFKKKINGETQFTDCETTVDLFSIDQYIEGLAKFITVCQTPMTIAVQGAWGSGKSSMMKMVEKKIVDKAICINFNTWQYSQFNLGDNLPAIFYSSLLEKIKKDSASDKIADLVKKAGLAMYGIAKSQLPGGLITEFVNGVENVVSPYTTVAEPKNVVDAIEEIRNSFGAVIKERCDDDKDRDRVVFFIDDLDRLPPQKAVELMEILKIVLECRKCVFVLAIDYDVVVRGVKAKYGNDIGEAKGRSFFDKIIQVPFSLPVGKYDIKQYISTLFRESKNHLYIKEMWNEEKEEVNECFIDLINCSIGCNPRSIKRLINTFSLLMLVEPEQHANNNGMMLFAALCLQLAYENVYNHLLEICGARWEAEGFIRKFSENRQLAEELNGVEKEKLKVDLMTDTEISHLKEFMRILIGIADPETMKSVSNEDEEAAVDEELVLTKTAHKRLCDVLKTASVTGTTVGASSAKGEFNKAVEYVYEVVEYIIDNRFTGKMINDQLQKVFDAIAERPDHPGGGTISDSCTRRLGLSKADPAYDGKTGRDAFSLLVQKFLDGNPQPLVDQVIMTIGKSKDPEAIRSYFNTLADRCKKSM